MSKNDLEMLLLGLPINELDLLKIALFQKPLDNPTINIDVEAYAIANSLPVDAAYASLQVAAKGLFERKFCYNQASSEITFTLISGLIGNPDGHKLSLELCDVLFNSLRDLGTAQLDAILTKSSNPPVSLMSRAYSAKLYLMIAELYDNNEVLISYDVLRKSLGIKTASYLLTHNFKRRVLNPAVADINEFSSLDVSYVDITDGRKITDFKFIVVPRSASTTK